jgi:hypothetical protein
MRIEKQYVATVIKQIIGKWSGKAIKEKDI